MLIFCSFFSYPRPFYVYFLLTMPFNSLNQVTPNLYGNLVANTAAGIAGGTGLMPGGIITMHHGHFTFMHLLGFELNFNLVRFKVFDSFHPFLNYFYLLNNLFIYFYFKYPLLKPIERKKKKNKKQIIY